MIERKDIKVIQDNAHIPEHIFTYVEAISGAEAFFFDPYIYYLNENTLIFIGYQLRERPDIEKSTVIFKEIVNKTRCEQIKAIFPLNLEKSDLSFINMRLVDKDQYYRLDVDTININQKNRNILKRAARELYIERTRSFNDEHKQLIKKFLNEKSMKNETKKIFENIDVYISHSDTTQIINARDKKGTLIAFDVVDTFSKEYVFYMFNIRTKTQHISGASDLLFYEMIKLAKEMDKRYINLGLGINDGVRFFKEKWGGKPFLLYYLFEGEPDKKNKILSIIDRFIKTI